MNAQIRGLHHITVMCGNPTKNADFYVNKLGLRMVKKTVNQDEIEAINAIISETP